ncbi:hypothetical protein TNCV_147911 [Trichonephila clavipes]|nr:hypothetical protein TNCV_147911 [Trichonephila clavipes]
MNAGCLMLVINEELRNSEVERRPNINGRNDYRGNYQNNRQGNQWFESRNRFLKTMIADFNDRGISIRNQGQNDDFSKGDQRNRGSRKILVEVVESKWDD